MGFAVHPRLSAIYYALLQSGYEYALLAREEAHGALLRPFAEGAAAPGFFAGARQETCPVYPWWPRAFLLEAAALKLTADGAAWRDWSGLQQRIRQAGNIADHERDDRLWTWLAEFPDALRQVMAGEGFRRYLAWERTWVAEQSERCAEELHAIEHFLEHCIQRYALPVRRVEVVLSPIKCVWSSDWHLVGDTFLFVSGSLRAEAVIHELLHLVVHPVVLGMQARITMRRYPGLDDSYYAAGALNAFEEYAVRCLTKAVLASHVPKSIADDLQALLDAAEEEPHHD